MTTPEFSRPVPLDSISESPRSLHVEAGEAERAALARRFGLKSVERLEGDARVFRRAAGIFAEGRMRGEVVQSCVVTDEALPVTLDEPFTIRFALAREPEGEEIELSAEECDVVFYEGGAIDLGEALAETMALSLDPFPRSPNADAALREAGVLSEAEAGPFGALAGLRDKLKNP